MSWSAIAEALQSRLNLLFPSARAHTRILNVKQSPEEKEWCAAYVDQSDGTVNCWQITRIGRKTVTSDSSTAVRLQHEIELHHHRSVVDCQESELIFHGEIDSVLADLQAGDRTLGGSCISLSTPSSEGIGHAMLAEAAMCHYAVIKVTAEESGTAGTSETVTAAPSEFWRGVGDALITWLGPQLTSLGMVSVAWDQGTSKAPTTPIDPRTECPRLRLRFDTNDIELSPSDSQRDIVQGSLWLQIRQAIGDDHHKRLVATAGLIAEKFIRQQRPDGLQSVGVEYMQLTRVNYSDPVEHPLEDPSLRVSVAEIQFEIRARR